MKLLFILQFFLYLCAQMRVLLPANVLGYTHYFKVLYKQKQL